MNYRAVIIMAITALTLTSTVLAATVPGQGTWKTTLQARDLNGDQKADAFHDTELNVTWLRDANMIGWRDWDSARNWVDALVWSSVISMIGVYQDSSTPALPGATLPMVAPIAVSTCRPRTMKSFTAKLRTCGMSHSAISATAIQTAHAMVRMIPSVPAILRAWCHRPPICRASGLTPNIRIRPMPGTSIPVGVFKALMPGIGVDMPWLCIPATLVSQFPFRNLNLISC